MTRVGWIDATGGISGDMLLGACLDAGVELGVVQSAIDALQLPERVVVSVERVQRCGLGATRAVVTTPESTTHRTLPDVLAVIGDNPRAAATFHALARAEAAVHRMPVEQVQFHEVGALDAVADVVGVVAALDALALDRLVCSPIALGGGQAQTAHGPIPVPGPAVVELLRTRSAPAFGGPIAAELATPTGVALMTTLADEFGALPAVRPELTGTGAGSRDPAGHPNVTRLIVGRAAEAYTGVEPAILLEANVDDLDPRLWPGVLTELLAAGASDAWLTPIVMKKGRPAHTLSVLAEPSLVEVLERIVFTHTSTIGLRRHEVAKRPLVREWVEVEVHGARVRVKLARLDGAVVSAEPEFDDVARLAAERGVPVKTVLAAARAAASVLT
jgi:uncharacterized protein (TIGR00299 family) protein